jgi:hypothetical protein
MMHTCHSKMLSSIRLHEKPGTGFFISSFRAGKKRNQIHVLPTKSQTVSDPPLNCFCSNAAAGLLDIAVWKEGAREEQEKYDYGIQIESLTLNH